MKHAVPIDNKNVMEDWIYEMFDSFITRPHDSRSIIGFIGDALVASEWSFGENYVGFHIIEGPDGFADSFAKILFETTNGDSSYVYTKVVVEGDEIVISFWYDED